MSSPARQEGLSDAASQARDDLRQEEGLRALSAQADAAGAPLPRALRPGRYDAPPIPPRFKRVWMRAAARLAFERGFRLEHLGLRHIPRRGPAILVSNHPTYVDPFLVGYGIERWITWMAWQEAFEWPGVGWLFRHMGALPVNTEKPAPSTFKTSMEILAQGRLLGVFFEGGRTRQSEYGLDPPQPGAARIALRARAPVIPVSISGARRAWPLERRLPRPGKVWVRFHPPIDPASFREGSARDREERLNGEVAQTILRGLPSDGRHRAWPERA